MNKTTKHSTISWNKSIWFFDLDDTLIDTNAVSTAASEGVERYLTEEIGLEQAQHVRNRFTELYDLLFAGYRAKAPTDWQRIPGGQAVHTVLLQRIEAAQPSVIQQHGHAKKWSRELLVKLAADDVGVKLTPQQIQAAGEAYWEALAQQVAVLPGAVELLGAIKAHGRPTYVITSSDGRLQMQLDGLFTYDPTYSAACKSQRIKKMKAKGIVVNAYRVGDPEDKPHPEFFEKIINVAKQEVADFDLKNCIMVGDSYGGDLETPQKHFGFGLVVELSGKFPQTTEQADRLVVTPDLIDFLKWFEGQAGW